MKYIDDIDLIGGSIHGAKLENLNVDPDFINTDSGRIYFNIGGQKLRLNNGTEYIDVSLPANFSDLIDTLGNNWINADFTFSPTAFNALSNISGLTGNNTLFDVISQLDDAINSSSGSTLINLNDVAETTPLEVGEIVYYNGDNFTFASIDQLIQTYGEITFASLTDVAVSGIMNNDMIFYDASSSSYKAGNPIFYAEDLSVVSNHTITHNLGVRFCNITLIDPSNYMVINNATITFTDVNTIDIQLAVAGPIYAVLVATPILITNV